MALSLSNPNPNIAIVDIIPQANSAETGQNSEPSLAIDPLDPSKIVAGAFSPVSTPFFLSTDGGATWSGYGGLDTFDKSLAWAADGSAALTATLTSNSDISLYTGTTASGNFGSPIFTYDGVNNTNNIDQPWIRTGPPNNVYVAYNDLGVTNGETASLLVSTDGGSTFTPVTLDRVGSPPSVGQDAPSVRLAVDGSTVYAAFTRWTSFNGTDSAGNDYYGAQVIVVRSDTGATDGFNKLGNNGDGISVSADPITSVFSNRNNSSITLGQERTGGDLAIAVDPNNSQHVTIAYDNAGAIGSGQLQLTVAESTDGGATWSTKFVTSAATRSAQPALAISGNGTIGLLYDNYDPATNNLSQHFLTTTNDFATTTDSTLAIESNASPSLKYEPYLGDFFDLTCVGNAFYGTFCAANADNGTNALFGNVSFLRNYTGAPGTSSFRLTNANGSAVSASIDPFFFTTAPMVTNVVVAPTSGIVAAGSDVIITLTTSEAVIVTNNPVLTLNNGATASYVPGASTNTALVFDYHVGTESTTDLRITGINQSAGTIADQVGDPLSSTLTTDLKLATNIFTWAQGVSGDWNAASNWTPAGVPVAGNTALITTSGTYAVTSSQDNSVALLQIERSATLAIASNTTLDVTGGSGTGALAGTMTVADAATLDLGTDANSTAFNNSGLIALQGGADPTSLVIAGGVALNGAGKIKLSGTNDQILSDGSAAALSNGNATAGNTIFGLGTIGDSNLSFVNQARGVINANDGGGGALTIDAASFSNAGIVEATGLGVLRLECDITDAATGLIKTGAAGSHVNLDGTTINGGTVSTVAGSFFDSIGGSSEIHTTTTIANAGRLGAEGGDLVITGAIRNSGALDANGHLLDLAGPVTGSGKATISGGGTLEFGAADIGINQSVTFTNLGGGTETLKFDAAASSTSTLIYKGTISGFMTPSDVIDFAGLTFQGSNNPLTAKLVSGNTVITVTEGADVVVFKLAGNHLNDSFTVSQDSGTGTQIIDPPATNAVHTSILCGGDGSERGALSVKFDCKNDQINISGSDAARQADNEDVDANSHLLNAGHAGAVTVGGPGNDHFVFAGGVGGNDAANFNTTHDVCDPDHAAHAQLIQDLHTLIKPDLHGDALDHHGGIPFADPAATQLHQIIQATYHSSLN